MTDLHAHLAALIKGQAPNPANAPNAETLELSGAIADCITGSLGAGELGDEVLPRDLLPAPAGLLPPLP